MQRRNAFAQEHRGGQQPEDGQPVHEHGGPAHAQAGNAGIPQQIGHPRRNDAGKQHHQPWPGLERPRRRQVGSGRERRMGAERDRAYQVHVPEDGQGIEGAGYALDDQAADDEHDHRAQGQHVAPANAGQHAVAAGHHQGHAAQPQRRAPDARGGQALAVEKSRQHHREQGAGRHDQRRIGCRRQAQGVHQQDLVRVHHQQPGAGQPAELPQRKARHAMQAPQQDRRHRHEGHHDAHRGHYLHVHVERQVFHGDEIDAPGGHDQQQLQIHTADIGRGRDGGGHVMG
ncbi:Uncharacterised protein [Bordetella pertussis]|nr:Uncharacterised protein [Bordetella pertussis]CFN06924.1 Uncharacterised protein [Bordetella pertussis]CFN24215.1 Uncharacterised protein [Bordetella pertussis]CFN66070.1 Uncharacterised protein [Bordetella pertussis]CFO05483.1 Uncharacterised protein [Bordetella pertussis]